MTDRFCRIIVGDALQALRAMPSDSVHCWVTSPPYLWLRRYLPAGSVVLREDLTTEERERVLAELEELGL